MMVFVRDIQDSNKFFGFAECVMITAYDTSTFEVMQLGIEWHAICNQIQRSLNIDVKCYYGILEETTGESRLVILSNKLMWLDRYLDLGFGNDYMYCLTSIIDPTLFVKTLVGKHADEILHVEPREINYYSYENKHILVEDIILDRDDLENIYSRLLGV